ncbi:MAG: hypothetical protein WAV16_03505 [Candidatus Moraniibacteriota bacterium]
MKKNNNFLKKNKVYINIALLVVVWLAFVFLIIMPSLEKLQNRFDAVQMRGLDLKFNDEKIKKISALKDDFSKIESEKNNLNVIFSKEEIVALVRDLEVLAQKTNNEIVLGVDEENKKIVNVDKTKKDAKENEILKNFPTKEYFLVEINLKGDYNGLIRFIDKLNNIKYYNSIVSFNLISEKVVAKEGEQRSGGVANGISLLSSGESIPALSVKVEDKLILKSNLKVAFYLIDKNEDGKK